MEKNEHLITDTKPTEARTLAPHLDDTVFKLQNFRMRVFFIFHQRLPPTLLEDLEDSTGRPVLIDL